MIQNVFEVKNLIKKFGDFTDVNGISFNVPKGKIIGLFGPTFVFGTARGSFNNQVININLLGISFIENLIYFSASNIFFNYMFKKAKDLRTVRQK